MTLFNTIEIKLVERDENEPLVRTDDQDTYDPTLTQDIADIIDAHDALNN